MKTIKRIICSVLCIAIIMMLNITAFALKREYITYSYDFNGNRDSFAHVEVQNYKDIAYTNNKNKNIPVEQYIIDNAADSDRFIILDIDDSNSDESDLETEKTDVTIDAQRASDTSGQIFGENYRLLYVDKKSETCIDVSEYITRSSESRINISLEKLGTYVLYYTIPNGKVLFYSEKPLYDDEGNLLNPESLYYEVKDQKIGSILSYPAIPQKAGYVFSGWKSTTSAAIGGGYSSFFVSPQPTEIPGYKFILYATWCPESEYEPIEIVLSSDKEIVKGKENGAKIILTTNYGVFADGESFPSEWRFEYENAVDEEQKKEILDCWKESWNVVGSDEIIVESARRINDKTVELTLSGNSSDIYKTSEIYIEFGEWVLYGEPIVENGETYYRRNKIKMDEDGVMVKMYRSDNSLKIARQRKLSSGSGSISRYTISFDADGSSTPAKQTVIRNDYALEPDTPQKDGFEFVGWYTDRELTKKYDFSVKVTKSMTLYAKWEKEDKTDSQMIFVVGHNKAHIFGESVVNDVAPVIESDRAFLPARFVAEALGADVKWNEGEKTVTITKDETVIVISINSDIALVDDKKIKLDAPAFISDDRTYTPIRFVAENLGAKVEWNEYKSEIVITK